MASVAVKNLKPNEVAELACTYAALILHDEGIDINGTLGLTLGNKIASLVNAAGVNIDAFWPKLFAKALDGVNVADFFAVGGGESSAPAAAPAAAPTKEKEPAKKDDKKDAKKPEKPAEKPAEEEDQGMGGLFDF